jgi:hypothetical protein
MLLADDAMTMMRLGFGEQGMMAFTIIISDPKDGATPYFIKVFNSCADDKARFWDMMKAHKNKPRMVFTALNHPDQTEQAPQGQGGPKAAKQAKPAKAAKTTKRPSRP